jgi:hypothetical protein
MMAVLKDNGGSMSGPVRRRRDPRVLNRGTDGVPAGAIYVGRPTKWGNPYPLKKEADRAACLERYEKYLQQRPDLKAAARRELRGKDLVCWCAPKACHADVLLRIANERA